jgi:peptidoglycan LD-endopeptidase LytH
MFHSIVSGSMSSRGVDKYGSGQFNARRDGGRRRHQGLDISARAGEAVYSPVDGTVIREAIPYAPFTGLLIRGTGEYTGYEVKLFYVRGLRCGSVRAGDQIGWAEDLKVKYLEITNHVHMEVRRQGVLLSPFEMYAMCF